MFMLVYKLAILVSLLSRGELNLHSFMCFCSLIVLFLSMVVDSGTSWMTRETLELFSSCESLRGNMLASNGKTIDELSNVPFCLKLILVTGIAHIAAFNAAAFSLVFEDLPVCVFPTFKWLGLVPQNSLPSIFWQLAFFPLEVLTLLPPMIATAFNFYTFLLGLGMIKFYADELRSAGSSMEIVLMERTLGSANVLVC